MIVTEVEPIRALEAALDGFQVMPMEKAALIGDIFITVTGNYHVINGEHFSTMKDGAIVCNSGHFNDELRWTNWRSSPAARRAPREFVDEYTLSDGRRLSILGEGRLINLAAAHGHPASVMDMSFAAQRPWRPSGRLKSKDKLEHKVYNVPKEVDLWVANLKLQTMGIAIDTLTAEQAKYLESWEMGT